MNYKKLSLWLMVCMAVMFGCCEQDPTLKIVEKNTNTLQDIVDNANAGDTIDLANYDGIKNYSATVNKTLTIKNGSLQDSTLTIEANDVKLDGLKDVSVTTSPKLGNGKLTIRDSELSDLLLNGGGSNSIYVEGGSITNLTMDYLNVRAVLGQGENDAVKVKNLIVKQDAIIQARNGEKATIDNMNLTGFSALASVGGGDINNSAGGSLDITNINFAGENTQMNLGGNISAEKIAANSTSKIVTNSKSLGAAEKNITVKEENASLTIIKEEKMTPLNLLVWGINEQYLVGDEINESKLIVMEENELQGDGLVYRQDSGGQPETVRNVWIKKNQFDIGIFMNGSQTETKDLKFTQSGSAKVIVTCRYPELPKEITFVENVMVIDPNESMGDITIDIGAKEPKITLYYAENGSQYNRLTEKDTIDRPRNDKAVIMAIASIPAGYNVDSWKINGHDIFDTGMNLGAMLKMPLSDVANYLAPGGENRISLVVIKDDNSKALSGTAAFNYDVEEKTTN